jgi:hypothetical protein
MSKPQSPNEAIRSLLFRKAELLAEQLIMRLTDAMSSLTKSEERAVIGALAGMEADVMDLRALMVLVRDYFQTTNNSKEEL